MVVLNYCYNRRSIMQWARTSFYNFGLPAWRHHFATTSVMLQNGRHLQRRRHVGESFPASSVSSSTCHVFFLCKIEAIAVENITSPTTSRCSGKRVQGHVFYCISNSTDQIDRFLRHHDESISSPHRRIAPLFGIFVAHDEFVAISDFRKDWNPKGGNRPES